MIDERDLRALLAEAAEAAPPPGRAPEELLAALQSEQAAVPAPRVRTNPRVLALAAAALVAVLGLARAIPGDTLPGPSLRGADGGDQTAETSERDHLTELEGEDSAGATTVVGPGFFETGGSAIGELRSESELERSFTPSGAAAPVAGGSGAGGIGGSPAPPVPVQAADSAKVVKTGSLVLEVADGAYAGTVARITTTADGLGGYVADSSTHRSGDALSGTITVRVPADRFDAFLSDLRELGTVESEGVRGTDVSAQHTDLQARLASVTATRERLQAVLAEASNVGDIIAVQDRITGVQTEIEQLQGQLRLLDDQVAMGTLSVALAEPGAEQVEPASAAEDGGLGGAWDDARRRFGNGVEDLVSWSGTGAVLVLVAAVVVVVGRLGWRRLRRSFL